MGAAAWFLFLMTYDKIFNMTEKFSGIVEMFADCNMPWWFVRVPKNMSQPYKDLADRGLIAVNATIGRTTWPTSLMPYGDGTHFVPVPAKVRKADNIQLGDEITVEFEIRER